MAPVPAQRSSKRVSSPILGARILKSVSRSRSEVGRVLLSAGLFRIRPRYSPAIMRIEKMPNAERGAWNTEHSRRDHPSENFIMRYERTLNSHSALRIQKLRLDSLINAENFFALFDRSPSLKIADALRVRSGGCMFDEEKSAGLDRRAATEMIQDGGVFIAVG